MCTNKWWEPSSALRPLHSLPSVSLPELTTLIIISVLHLHATTSSAKAFQIQHHQASTGPNERHIKVHIQTITIISLTKQTSKSVVERAKHCKDFRGGGGHFGGKLTTLNNQQYRHLAENFEVVFQQQKMWQGDRGRRSNLTLLVIALTSVTKGGRTGQENERRRQEGDNSSCGKLDGDAH